jgi:Outer membrane protein beta-barrel domain
MGLVAAFARPAAAEWQLTPFIGLTLDGSTTFFDPENEETGGTFGRKHLTLGGSGSLFWQGPIGVEGLFVFVPGIFDRENLANIKSSRTLALMGNVVVTIPRAWSEHGLRPFASGGFGLLQVAKEDPLDLFPVRRNVLGYNVGGGAVGPITERTGVRFEVRLISYVKSGDIRGVSFDRENLRYWTATVGVVFRY